MKKITSAVLLSIFILINFTACSSQIQTEEEQSNPDTSQLTVSIPSGVLMSETERITNPEVSDTNLDELVSGNTDFAVDLYHVISVKEGNLFFSPFSVSSALSMTYAGAIGETEKQMRDTLRSRLSQEDIHPAFNALDIQLNQRDDAGEEGFTLNLVNAIWGQKDFSFLKSYLDVLAENYGSGLRITDFAEEPEKSRITINDWVSQQTADKINELIPSGVINNATRLVLTNAVYFKAAWQARFNEKVTTNSDFYPDDSDPVTVPMMKQTSSFGYSQGSGYQAVELPYDGGEISLVVIMPDPGHFKETESSLNTDLLDTVLNDIKPREIILSLPKFELESSFDLKDTLSRMGMPDAFSDKADFSGMTGNRDLVISDVIHKAFVAVDENGTEAAAATAVSMVTTGLPENPLELILDHPFIFLIRDIPTGTILFIGRMVNPDS